MPGQFDDKAMVFKLPFLEYRGVFLVSFLVMISCPFLLFSKLMSPWQTSVIFTSIAFFISMLVTYALYRGAEVFIEVDAEKLSVKSPEKMQKTVTVPFGNIRESIVDGTGAIVIDFGDGLVRLPDRYRGRDGTDLKEYLRRQIGRNDASKSLVLSEGAGARRADHEVYRLAPVHYVYMNTILIGMTVVLLAASYAIAHLRHRAPAVAEGVQQIQHAALDPNLYVLLGARFLGWIVIVGNLMLWHVGGGYHITVEVDGFVAHHGRGPIHPKRYRYSDIEKIVRSWDGMYKVVLKNGKSERINSLLRNSRETFSAFIQRAAAKLS